MPAYYNEIDPYAAQWLRNLIAAGHIAPGDVDTRSIEDISPDDLRGYAQHHFFAGLGGWSHALREAGWPDDKPVWTGSCPCQPFSAAGKGNGFADERHLWPVWHWLIKQCRPPILFGEQVEAAIKHDWLDLVQTDLEGIGYAFAAAGIPAAGVGAPHIRQRLWFVAYTTTERHKKRNACESNAFGWTGQGARAVRCNSAGGVADTYDTGSQGRCGMPECADQCVAGPNGMVGGLADTNCRASGQGSAVERWRYPRSDAESRPGFGSGSAIDGLADAHGNGCEARSEGSAALGYRQAAEPDSSVGKLADTERNGSYQPGEDATEPRSDRQTDGLSIGSSEGLRSDLWADALDGFWADADWLFCRDGKWRPVEPGAFPLAPRLPGDVGRLRAYGNAICAPVAQAFIRTVSDVLAEFSPT